MHHHRTRRSQATIGLCLLGLTSGALANGRFPTAQHLVVGPGTRADTIVLRATFGLVVSTDSGRTFRWVCEEALGYAGLWDPPIVLRDDQSLLAGTPTGLVNLTGCEITPVAEVGAVSIADLDVSTDGRHVVGITDQPGDATRVFMSDARSSSFVLTNAMFSTLSARTIEMAPSNPQRLYVSGMDTTTRLPRLFRSDDGGGSFQSLSPDFHLGEDAWIAGVHPTNPDVLYVRSNVATGTLLLRSLDGGTTLEIAGRTQGSMLGVALADDGRTVWMGGPDDGLQRSVDGGTFNRIADVHVACLRHHAGSLYICGDWLRDPFALARWDDGASTLAPVLRFDAIEGAVVCPPAPATWDVCKTRWPVQARVFAGSVDAGRRDAATMDGVGLVDASVDMPDREVMGMRSGCSCHTTMPTQHRDVVPVILALVLFRRCRPSSRRGSLH